jgi:phospholipid-binding lipoprotein MlaA
MFWFNLRLDEYVLRPVATAYTRILPDGAQRSVDRFFRNLGVIPRFANNLFQGKFPRAGQEVGRFVVNTTLGGAGFFDVAEPLFGWRAYDEDFGQTLAVHDASSGPYLVLPFYGPSTIRDAVGLVVDGAMNPMNYLLSTTEVIAIRGGLTVADAINSRSPEPGALRGRRPVRRRRVRRRARRLLATAGERHRRMIAEQKGKVS